MLNGRVRKQEGWQLKHEDNNSHTSSRWALFLHHVRGMAPVAFTGFFSAQNFLNLLIDNAYLLILAVGMTFVIISGGIDLSVGLGAGLVHHGASSLLEKSHAGAPIVVIPLVLADGDGASVSSWGT